MARTLCLDKTSDSHSLLKLFNFNFYDALNSTVHTVFLSDALEAIEWLSAAPADKVSTTLGWPVDGLARHVAVFVKAAKQLLPRRALRPDYRLQKADASFVLNGHVRNVKERNHKLMNRARTWGVTMLSEKSKKFFKEAIREGLVPSKEEVEGKASKEEMEKRMADMDAELAQLKEMMKRLVASRTPAGCAPDI